MVSNSIAYLEEEVVHLKEVNRDYFHKVKDNQVNHNMGPKGHPYFDCLHHLIVVTIRFSLHRKFNHQLCPF